MTTLLAIIGTVATLASAFSIGSLIKFHYERKDQRDHMRETTEENSKAIEEIQKEMELIKAMSLGSLYDRAKFLGETYIKKGFVTLDEYSDWQQYLYKPYKDAGGNGTIDKIAAEINKLPIEG